MNSNVPVVEECVAKRMKKMKGINTINADMDIRLEDSLVAILRTKRRKKWLLLRLVMITQIVITFSIMENLRPLLSLRITGKKKNMEVGSSTTI